MKALFILNQWFGVMWMRLTNFIKFHKSVYGFNPCESHSTLVILKTCMEYQCESAVKYGGKHNSKMISEMRETISVLDNLIRDEYHDKCGYIQGDVILTDTGHIVTKPPKGFIGTEKDFMDINDRAMIKSMELEKADLNVLSKNIKLIKKWWF